MFLYFYHSSIPGRTALAPSSAEDRAIPVSAEIQCKALPGSITALRESQCPSEFPKILMENSSPLFPPLLTSRGYHGYWSPATADSQLLHVIFYVHLD